MSLDELLRLSHHFDLSVEEFFNPHYFKKRIDYLSSRIHDADDCKMFLIELSNRLIRMENGEGYWELCSDLPPIFHLMGYPEASAFFLYEGMLNKKTACFTVEKFFNDLNKAGIFKIQNEIYQSYLRVNSREIYSLYSFSQLIEKLTAYMQNDSFKRGSLFSVIRMQLQELLQVMEKWAGRGKKKEGNFQLYLSESLLNNNFMLSHASHHWGLCLLPVKGHGIKLVNDLTVKSALSECMQNYRSLYSCMYSIGEIQRVRIFKNFVNNLNSI